MLKPPVDLKSIMASLIFRVIYMIFTDCRIYNNYIRALIEIFIFTWEIHIFILFKQCQSNCIRGFRYGRAVPSTSCPN